MTIEIKIPVFPESITEGTLVSWHKQAGDVVQRDDILADVETDKVVFEVPAVEDGVVQELLVKEGETVVSGQLIARLDKQASSAKTADGGRTNTDVTPRKEPVKQTVMAPAAARLVAEHDLDASAISGTGKGGRILKEDVLRHISQEQKHEQQKPKAEKASVTQLPVPTAEPVPGTSLDGRPEKRVTMSRLRARVAERMLQAQHNAAILTTFNDVNMQAVMQLRQRYRDQFEKVYSVRLGFMSFFVKAVIEALKRFPEVNASIDGDEVVYHGFFDIGIAVGSPRGLVVPILRDADQMSMADIEKKIRQYSDRAENGKLTMEDITGGTFTITNGGVFGSLLSTPILNPPQSGILGMHRIQDRPVAEDGQVVIRPIMNLALSYDHRIIDGREAVQFLVTIKEELEDPSRILLEI